MKKALERALAFVAASTASLAVLSSVAALADADRAAMAVAKQSKAALLAVHSQRPAVR